MSSVESAPGLSDDVYHDAASVLAQQLALLEQLLPSFQLDPFSSPQGLAVPARLSVAAATQEYHSAMESAHQRMLTVWESATTVRREKAMQELDQWLCCLPSSWRKTLLSCTPTDVISFMERCWM